MEKEFNRVFGLMAGLSALKGSYDIFVMIQDLLKENPDIDQNEITSIIAEYKDILEDIGFIFA